MRKGRGSGNNLSLAHLNIYGIDHNTLRAYAAGHSRTLPNSNKLSLGTLHARSSNRLALAANETLYPLCAADTSGFQCYLSKVDIQTLSLHC